MKRRVLRIGITGTRPVMTAEHDTVVGQPSLVTRPHAMAGLVPAIPIREARRFSDRDHRHKAGDDVRGGGERLRLFRRRSSSRRTPPPVVMAGLDPAIPTP
ncbi:hypothetical protein J4G37_20060 [Microvirga sp. 3-52]|nr:hypothetical protein [Microvirga sp. 3-52]